MGHWLDAPVFGRRDRQCELVADELSMVEYHMDNTKNMSSILRMICEVSSKNWTARDRPNNSEISHQRSQVKKQGLSNAREDVPKYKIIKNYRTSSRSHL